MGRYIDPGDEGFREIIADEYIDKTGIIELINKSIGKKNKLFCISRPRRFGKSYAAAALCAYYDCSIDSHELFDRLEIAKSDDYEKHINKYNVVCLDIAALFSDIKRQKLGTEHFSDFIINKLREDMSVKFKDIKNMTSVSDCLLAYSEYTNKKFVFIIDEWDIVIREGSSEAQNDYLELLREIFKNTLVTPKIVAAAYMTGILPIKKVKSQSAISDFREYTALAPGKFAEYIGFNESDINTICNKYGLDIVKMKQWYDGYTFGSAADIYNPYSVMCAADLKQYGSYWKKTSAAASLAEYLDMNFEGLQDEIIRLIRGEEIIVDTDDFQNDVTTFTSKDDVLTLLIHLGYLTYCGETHLARIPNEELRSEFRSMLKRVKNPKLTALIADSKKILEDTLAGNENDVAAALDKLCGTNYAPQYYNGEQALRSVIKLAYLAAVDHYIKIEELPSGKGLADIVYLPQRGSQYPSLIIEMKWDKSEESAIEQIKQKNYPAVLHNYGGEILLVGINYDLKEKNYQCRIERAEL